MFKIIIFIVLAMNIFANDLINLYRNSSIEDVKKEIENRIKTQEYWNNYLKNINTDFGFYETKQYIIIAEKENKNLTLYLKEGNDYKQVLKENIIIGENPGDKFLEGDKKTPEGSYELTKKITTLDQFYGPFAIVTEYPNVFDRSLNKKGHGIWIHGMPFNGDREKFTQGCLALDNDKLENLNKNMDYKKAILITSNSKFKKAKKEDLSLILSTVYKWRDAWKYSNIDEYLSYYSSEFRRADRSNFKIFAMQKKRIFEKNENKIIKLKNFDISPYPNSLNKNLYKVIMDEEYYSPSVKFIGKKELYVEISDNKFQILSED